MTCAARSLFGFAVWCLVSGAGLLIAPALFLSVVGLSIAEPVYVRIIGFILIEIGIIYVWLARNGNRQAFRLSVMVRMIPVILLPLFVVTGAGPWQLLLFAVVDAASAVHTWFALKHEGPHPD